MTYGYLKKIIARGSFDAEELKDKMDAFLLADRITDEQYKELTELIGGTDEEG